ncbi:MAG: DUF309 domain-containing protein [Desulfurivibrio sp.]|nr:DUF309 domain-containing protein [Desulfurivibrio sp.]MBU3935928.1 DUF309 domain-containing protein [Pseudomonadota bacterium]MBU4118177.1 DUF309 domain-containing protein [Pseudomonadota bacterium]
MTPPLFEPFQDRLSRDIRNDLSEALLPALNKNTLAPVRTVAQGYLQKGLAAPYVAYIETRLARYATALDLLARSGREDALTRGLVLWDLELFFEVHEVLEQAWHGARGAEKEILQALIRAAGFYIKGEFGYVTGGAKMAARAVTALEKNQQACTGFDLDILLQSLRNLDPVPPKLFRQDIAH